jgi:hypothetical protein
MNTSYGVNTYTSHDLNISMKTSSGDKIKLDFANEQSASYKQEKDENGTLTSMSFSSMQSFKYSIDSNGIDAQDRKEIDAFMKIAQPIIDEYLKKLQDSEQKSPASKLAKEVASIFEPTKDRDQNTKNQIKSDIVRVFDNALSKLELPEEQSTKYSIEDILKHTQMLLKKTLDEFDDFNKNIYA